MSSSSKSSSKTFKPTSKPTSKPNPLQALPTEVLAGEILSKYLPYTVGKNVSKIFRTRHGGSTELQRQFQKAVPVFDEKECLEAIYTKYPFLPREDQSGQTKYIFIQQRPIERFQRDCVEQNFPLQIGRCCFRIDYYRWVLEKIFNPDTIDLGTKEGKKKFMAALEGLKDTFRFSLTPKSIILDRWIYLFYRLYEFLNETENYSLEKDEVLFCLDMLKKIQDYLERRKLIPKNMDVHWKLRTLASFVHKLPSFEERLGMLMRNKNFWVRLTGSQKNFYEFMVQLITWFPPSNKRRESVYRKWNHYVMSQIFDPEEKVPLKTKKIVFGTFTDMLDDIIIERTWDTYIDYYLTYLPYFPMEIVNVQSLFRVLEKMPKTTRTVDSWIQIYHFLKTLGSGMLSYKKMDTVIVKSFKKFVIHTLNTFLIEHDGRTKGLLEKLIALYRLFVEEVYGKEEVIENLMKVVLSFVKKYRLVPGKGKQILENLKQIVQR
jgi:hypothetical protein